jgi:hypothetical protein
MLSPDLASRLLQPIATVAERDQSLHDGWLRVMTALSVQHRAAELLCDDAALTPR